MGIVSTSTALALILSDDFPIWALPAVIVFFVMGQHGFATDYHNPKSAEAGAERRPAQDNSQDRASA